ncbi:hypothetical protein SLS64_004747 [Diaporthe eres]
MHFQRVCGLLFAVAGVATASPFSHAETSVTADAALRLIKVSESDSGTWVREDEKIENYVAKGVNFVDITDMTNPSISVTKFSHSFNQPSVIAKIPGSSSDALVIVGAHFDSTGGSSTARGPGADDNGSGVVVIFEALRILAQAGFAPRDTLEFHFYAGEEGGLLGSKDIFSSYKTANKQVLAMMNQDMAGYSPSGVISVYTDYVDSSLTAYVRRVAEGYTGLKTSTDACGYGCSDHHSAYSNGFLGFLVEASYL